METNSTILVKIPRSTKSTDKPGYSSDGHCGNLSSQAPFRGSYMEAFVGVPLSDSHLLGNKFQNNNSADYNSDLIVLNTCFVGSYAMHGQNTYIISHTFI